MAGEICAIRAALGPSDLPSHLLCISVKDAAHAAIEALPDTASLQDAADRIALLAAREKGRQAVREDRWKSQEEVEKLLPSWFEK